jgi:hypothetical protein
MNVAILILRLLLFEKNLIQPAFREVKFQFPKHIFYIQKMNEIQKERFILYNILQLLK